MRGTALLLAMLFIILGGCSSTNDVVSKGPFQKRKLRPGWHVDLAWRQGHERQAALSMNKEEAPMPMKSRAFHPVPHVSPALLASNTNSSPVTPVVRTPRQIVEVVDILKPENTAATGQENSVGTAEGNDGPRRWNRMALISGVFLLLSALVLMAGGGEILFYLLTFALLTGVIGLLLAIKHKERGKGIAIAAIAIPTVIIALVIAALRSIWG